ncbi:helix-turn-helix transcriptional regulator [Legionella septentrionalis]|uniref:helix-turn-helix transcriptional regulator n=1 Tax=Legionella septentrionalis TaxID=2498109 RepID=UPI000F8CC5C8|nr:PAS domain-containing protein [Legionella septentrionalis]RUR08881.1 HTH domain-containing protein [Legionella septentrionalis]
MNEAIKVFLPTAEAISRLLHPYAEVIVHDIIQNKIAAIYHPFSKRRAGDPSLLVQDDIKLLNDCIGPYEKTNWNGKKIKSVSSIIRDKDQQAVGMLCINLDISAFEQCNELIKAFIQCEQLLPKPEPLFKDDWQERIHNYVHHYLNEHKLTFDTLNRKEKKALVIHLHRVGAFSGKNSAQYIAEILNVSRATIYNYLGCLES